MRYLFCCSFAVLLIIQLFLPTLSTANPSATLLTKSNFKPIIQPAIGFLAVQAAKLIQVEITEKQANAIADELFKALPEGLSQAKQVLIPLEKAAASLQHLGSAAADKIAPFMSSYGPIILSHVTVITICSVVFHSDYKERTTDLDHISQHWEKNFNNLKDKWESVNNKLRQADLSEKAAAYLYEELHDFLIDFNAAVKESKILQKRLTDIGVVSIGAFIALVAYGVGWYCGVGIIAANGMIVGLGTVAYGAFRAMTSIDATRLQYKSALCTHVETMREKCKTRVVKQQLCNPLVDLYETNCQSGWFSKFYH